MSVGVVLGSIVGISGIWFFRGHSLQPFFQVGVKAGLVIVDKDTGRDVHRIHKAKSFTNATLLKRLGNLRRNVQEGPS